MKEKSTSDDKYRARFNGKRHNIRVQYTNKDAQERLFAFLGRYGNDLNPHECAVDYFAENPEFSEGFRVYATVHVLEDIIKKMVKRRRPDTSQQFPLPIEVAELGGLPLFVPYMSDTGQLRFRAIADAESFHLESWLDMDNKSLRTRSKSNQKVKRVVEFFLPLMKDTTLTVRQTCEMLNKDPN